MTLAGALLAILRAQIDGRTAEWLTTSIDEAAGGELPRLLHIYTDASRWLGSAPLVLDVADTSRSRALAGIPMQHWAIEDAGRIVFLLTRFDARRDSGDDCVAAAAACYEQGDTREQRSWLRTAGLLPRPELLLPLVIDACRTSIVPLFEAIACENPFPATHFPDRIFNQLVLKALFNGIAMRRIVGLTSRLNPELSRMACDYANERRAAGRPVPADISTVSTGGATARYH